MTNTLPNDATLAILAKFGREVQCVGGMCVFGLYFIFNYSFRWL